MTRSTNVRQRGPNGRFLTSHPSDTTTEAQHSVGLFALPPELRLAVYRCLFSMSEKSTLRRLKDITSRREFKLVSNSILTTCKTVLTEALPLFYASQIFHYPAELNGLSRQPPIMEAYLQWVTHISIEVSVTPQSYADLDAIVATHVQTIIEHCTKLSSLTLHIIPATAAGELTVLSLALVPICFADGGAAKALSMLRPRLDQLSIVTFGNWDTLYHLREAIADDNQWVEGGRCYGGWPRLSLSKEQSTAVSVRQRRYTLAGNESVIHPHSQCIRVFHIYRSAMEKES